jgi:hypothetical protein
MQQIVFLDWSDVGDEDAEGWDQRRCLYSYRARDGEILYIGKAWGQTVRERWCLSAKPIFWRELERQRRIFHHSVLVGTLALCQGDRLTHALLADVESLLINRLQPWGNIQSRASRIERPGLVVQLRGVPLAGRRKFRDVA